MKLDQILLNEEGAEGATTAASIAAVYGGTDDMDIGSIRPNKKRKKRNVIKRIFNESQYDKESVLSYIKNSEVRAENEKNSVGFALEDSSGDIVKVFVNKEQASDFESALKNELKKNQSDEHSHREIGEIIYDLKDDFEIVDVQMMTIPEDEEEISEIDIDDGQLEIEDESEDGDGTLEVDTDEEGDDETSLNDRMDNMTPSMDDSTPKDDTSAASTLDSVIDMMKADAEAKAAEANARAKEAEADIAKQNALAAQDKLKKSEEILDMEAYYDEKKTEKKEADQLAKLAKYKHDIANDQIENDLESVATESYNFLNDVLKGFEK